MEADNRYISPHLAEYEESVRQVLDEGKPVSRTLFGRLDRDDPTMQLRNLFLEYKKYDAQEFDAALQTHVAGGANPYVLINRFAMDVLFSEPGAMQRAVEIGVDFNLANQAYDGDEVKISTENVFKALHRQSASLSSVSGFRGKWEKYAQSQKILIDSFPELKPDMDDVKGGENSEYLYDPEYQDYNTYMLHRGLMEAYERHGVFTTEEVEAFFQGFEMHIPAGTDVDVKSFHDEEFDALKVGYTQYIVQEGDSLWAIAQRYEPYSEFSNVRDIVDRIVEDHKLDGETIQPGMALKIPISSDVNMITAHVIDGGTLTKGAYKMRDQLYNSQGSPFLDALSIARLNNMDISQTIHPGDQFTIPLKDRFASVAPLYLSSEKDVTLAVIEAGNHHHKQTFKIASKLAYHLSGDGDDGDVIAISVPKIGRIVQPKILTLYQSDEARNGEVIFSKSYAEQHGRVPPERAEELYDKNKRLYSEFSRQEFEMLEDNGVINFLGAGNGHDIAPNVYVVSSEANAVRSVTVGAIHIQDDIPYIAPYSSVGADLCAEPVRKVDGVQLRGTSYSTPDMAEHYHQMAKAYGNDLTHEEIMAAAYYSTDLRLKDFDVLKHPDLSNKNEKGEVNGRLQEGQAANLPWTKFHINAAGIPYHPRAGTGMIDIEQWGESLDRMKLLKDKTGNSSEMYKQQVNLRDIEPDTVREQSKDLYVYKVPIDTDMTLGKITLSLPQERGHRSTASIQGPSGTRLDMPYLKNAMFSTHVLAYENVSEGDFITIKTEERFTDDADITIRGHEAGNTIEAFRDYMIQNDLTQRPESIFQVQDVVPEGQGVPLSVKVGVN